MRLYIRLFAIFLILSNVLSPLIAGDFPDLYHIIAYYSFDIKGKSRESIIREMIVPKGGDAPFTTKDAMVRALEAKRDKLNNLRIFEEVSYTYEAIHADDVAIRYRVKFFIDDAFTFLAIPYPKYDSNYGFRIGVKAYDKNLLGSFADLYFVINATQIENQWEDWEWRSEIAISNIPAGDSSIDIEGTAEAIQRGDIFEQFFYTAKIDWRGISLAQTTLDFHIDIDENSDTADEFDQLLTTSVQWDGLPWFNSSLRVRPSFQFRQGGDGAPWDIDNASFHSSVNPVHINGETYVFSNTIKLKFPHEYVQSTTSLNLVNSAILGMPVSFWISADNYFSMGSQSFYNNTYAVGTSIEAALPLAISYKGSYIASLRDRTETELNHVPVFSTTQSVTFGRVNWKSNFRHGLKGTFSGKADYALFTQDFNRMDYLNYSVQGELEAYLSLGKKAGLSTRSLGFYSYVPSFDWYEDQTFPTFLPNREISASEMMRGILDDTYEEALGSADYQKLGAVLNMDATLMFLKFRGFAEGFITAFMDVGIFTQTYAAGGNNDISWNDVTMFKTVGIEGYGILDKFPSYPIRGSLGFNLDDILRHVNGEIGFQDIEFELSVGMGLHY